MLQYNVFEKEAVVATFNGLQDAMMWARLFPSRNYKVLQNRNPGTNEYRFYTDKHSYITLENVS